MPYFLPLFYLWEGVCPFCPRWWWWLQRWRWWWLWWRRRRGGGRVALDRRAKDKSPPCRWKVTTLHLPPHPRKISSASILQEHVFDNIDNRSKRVVSSISDGDERRSREGKNGRTFLPLEKPQALLKRSQPSRGGVGDVLCMIVLFWRTCSITVTPLSQWVVYRALRACFRFYAFKECQICSLVGRLFLRIHLKEEDQFGVPPLPDDFYQVWNPTALCISFSECFHIDSSLMYVYCHNWQIDIDIDACICICCLRYMYLYKNRNDRSVVITIQKDVDFKPAAALHQSSSRLPSRASCQNEQVQVWTLIRSGIQQLLREFRESYSSVQWYCRSNPGLTIMAQCCGLSENRRLY